MNIKPVGSLFKGVAVKRLSAVEANINLSNQHEFNGIQALRSLLGDEDQKNIPARFIWVGGEDDTISEEGFLSWYDARRKHPVRTEYRLYFPDTSVMEKANAGDSVFIAVQTDGTITVIVAPANSTEENQIVWLFGVEKQLDFNLEVKTLDETAAPASDYAILYVLGELGIEFEPVKADYSELLLKNFGKRFPTTREFSAFARSTIPEIKPLDDPDTALIKWMEQEEILFRNLEKIIVSDRLAEGFHNGSDADVDGFLKFSLSVQNRRKSRVGFAFENHLEQIFQDFKILYARGAETENRAKPDFLFPSKQAYDDRLFPQKNLFMLGVKSTCKDRWRQVLSEAARIPEKHLITLEPGISVNQTNEMQAANLQLVLPKELHDTYRPDQRSWLIGLGNFIDLVQMKS